MKTGIRRIRVASYSGFLHAYPTLRSFQCGTNWPQVGDWVRLLAAFCLYGCFSNTGYLGLRRTQHHNDWGRPETTV